MSWVVRVIGVNGGGLLKESGSPESFNHRTVAF